MGRKGEALPTSHGLATAQLTAPGSSAAAGLGSEGRQGAMISQVVSLSSTAPGFPYTNAIAIPTMPSSTTCHLVGSLVIEFTEDLMKMNRCFVFYVSVEGTE